MGPTSLLGLLCIISVLHMIRCWIISVPTTVTAVEGSCAVVPCHTQPHARVIWYKYHNVQYPVVCDELRPYQVEPLFKGRTYVVGKAAEGNCTLKFTEVKMADNNLQIYVWINPDSTATQKFYDKIVTISVEKKFPMIFVQSEILEGSIFEINCSIEHSCPYFPPLFSWSTSQVLNNMTSLTFSAKRGVLWIYRETLQGTATKDMHKTQITCSAQLGSLTTTSPEITLDVLSIPATVKIEMETDTVIEGGSIIAVCAANSNPKPHKYSWIRKQMGNYSKISSTWRRMSFKNITRHTSLSCMAHNGIGVGQSDWMDLIVHCKNIDLFT
ncbi:hypothetical protein GOODEAATRI_029103 [Goodea atripinnis]|uniref:Ig-like domain-containing protein n=1 Tax=Goodea atripinnis TaxID=208336 RepID=A0ABV0NEM0_9TELE